MDLKRATRGAALLTSLCLMVGLAGCSARPAPPAGSSPAFSARPGAAGEPAVGRWVEQELPLENGPEGAYPLGVYLQDDGTAGVFWSDREGLYAGAAGQAPAKLWESATGAWPAAAARRGGRTVYALATPQTTTLTVLENGREKELAVPWEEAGNVMSLSFVDDDTVFVHYMPRLLSADGYLYSGHAFAFLSIATGEVLCENALPEGWYGNMAANAGHAFALYKNELAVYDRQGVLESGLGGPLAVQGDWGGVGASEQNEVYFADKTGIYRAAAGGSLVETLVSGGSCAFGQPGWYVRQLLPDGTGGIFLLLGNSEENAHSPAGHSLWHYYFDETLPAANEQELVVWSLTEQPTARAAVMEYRRRHPEVAVAYEPAVTGDAGESAIADAVTALNTQLLAGGGPDVLLLDGLDWQKYAGQGLLAPLQTPQGLVQNIASPLRTGDVQYVLPARFTLPVLLGQAEDLAGLEDTEALLRLIQSRPPRPAGLTADDSGYYEARPAGERYAMSFTDQNVLLDFFYPLYLPSLLENGGLNAGALRDMYRQLKAVSDRYGLPAAAARNGADMGSWSAFDNLYEFGMGAALGWCDVADLEMLAFNHGEAGAEGGNFTAGVRAAAQPGLAPGLYQPVCVAAVNLAARLPEQAQEFVGALVSETVQSSALGDGLPVLQSALDARLAAAKEGNAPLAAADLEALIREAATPLVQNAALKEMLRGPALDLCAGRTGLDEAVAAAQKAAALYLAEKQ